MVLTTKEASYIRVLRIVISVLPISSTLLQDGYHVRFKQKTVNKGEEEPIKQCGSPRNKCAQSINLHSDGIPDAISMSNSDTISVTIAETISDSITDSNPEAIPEAISESNSDNSHCSTLLQEGGLRQWLCEAVGEHLSSRYVAQVDLSISSHICSKIVLGCNVCNCSSAVDSVLDGRDQWLWIGGHMRDSRDADLVKRCEICVSLMQPTPKA